MRLGHAEAADRTLWWCRQNPPAALVDGVPEEATLAHLEFMLTQIRETSDEGKANRWLGYMQGVALVVYGVSLDTLREINVECL